jgi:hypothetical protein
LQKYKFKIKTNNKIIVENINILSTDKKAAEARLAQMYLRYEILDVQEIDGTPDEVLTFDKVIDLISK